MTVVILLFLLSQAKAHDLEGSLYCAQGGETRRLSDIGAATPSWFPNGDMICYVRHTEVGDVFHFISPCWRAPEDGSPASPADGYGRHFLGSQWGDYLRRTWRFVI